MSGDTERVHLIGSLGTNPYQEAVYTFEGREHQTRFAPVAVAALCVPPRGKVTIVATAEALDRHGAALRAELATVGFDCVVRTIGAGVTRRETFDVLTQLIDAVAERERVALDFSLGFRHLPFHYAAALSYLSAFKGIEIAGIYYGAFEQAQARGDQRVAPILDLTATFQMMQWYHAVQTANEAGDLRPLQRAFQEAIRAEKAASHARHTLENVSKALDDLAENLAAGLPLGTGIAARRVLEALRYAEQVEDSTQLAHLSLQRFADRLEGWAVPPGVKSKSALQLDEDELRRQLRLIRWYADRGNVQEALLLLREWILSRALLQVGDPTHWLGYLKRKKFESALRAAGQRGRLKIGNAGDIGSLWDQITDDRNLLAHADTDDRDKLPSTDQVRRWIGQCEELLDRPFELAPPGRDRVLLTPLGLTPGVVYTAAREVRPDQVWIITSRDAEATAAQALAAAGMAALPRSVHALADPFAGLAEARALPQQLLPGLQGAGELIVNLTGGTTMMQLAVEEIVHRATRIGIPVQRILLVDRRTVQEQRADPYQPGEVVYLSGPDGVSAEGEMEEH